MNKIIVFIFCGCLIFPACGADVKMPASPYDSLIQRLDNLREKLAEKKRAENSIGNRILGAASMGVMGMGAASAMSAAAEQSVDDAAERDMRAYLATFTCEYGAGRRVRGGENNIELSGGNDLLSLVTEYKNLAADLRERKQALGMAPGIESDEIIDPATSGLYDNVGAGRGDGAYASISRAITDKNGADATELEQRKSDTKKKKDIGTVAVVGGAVVSAGSNLIMNKDNYKSDSDKK